MLLNPDYLSDYLPVSYDYAFMFCSKYPDIVYLKNHHDNPAIELPNAIHRRPVLFKYTGHNINVTICEWCYGHTTWWPEE